jgi:ribonuclease HI
MTSHQIKYYAVRRGYIPGIYTNWKDCNAQVFKYKMQCYKCFDTLEKAKAFMLKRSHSKNEKIKSDEAGLTNNYKKRRTGTLTSAKYSHKAVETKKMVHMDITINNSISSPRYNQSKKLFEFPPARSFPVNFHGPQPRRYPFPLIRGNYSPPPGHIYIDGACINNGHKSARAGIGVFFGHNHCRNTSERLYGPNQTSCRAEVQAGIRALEQSQKPITNCGNSLSETMRITRRAEEFERVYRNPVIITDCQFLIDAAEKYLDKWLLTGKTNSGRVPSNMDLLWKLKFLLAGRNVTWKFVSSHSGDTGNNAADLLARAGAKEDREPFVDIISIPFKY